jgi:hypothetical protein
MGAVIAASGRGPTIVASTGPVPYPGELPLELREPVCTLLEKPPEFTPELALLWLVPPSPGAFEIGSSTTPVQPAATRSAR